ncbi:MAG: PAS domain-containing protein [Opitutus sp.]|nr:PAS domain-containing protein [Opitutus sp.]
MAAWPSRQMRPRASRRCAAGCMLRCASICCCGGGGGRRGTAADIEAFEDGPATADTLLFNTAGQLRFGDAQWAGLIAAPTGSLYATVKVPVFRREWQLRMRTRPEFEARGNRWLSWLMLGGGVLVSLFGAGFTWALVNSRSRALRLAGEMTASLRQAEAESHRLALVASRTTNMVVLADADWKIEWVNDSFTRFFGYTFAEAVGQRPSELLHRPATNLATPEQINQAGVRVSRSRARCSTTRRNGRPAGSNWISSRSRISTAQSRASWRCSSTSPSGRRSRRNWRASRPNFALSSMLRPSGFPGVTSDPTARWCACSMRRTCRSRG